MMNDTCVSTWRKKVLAGYQFCLVNVVSELEEHAEIISRMIKGNDLHARLDGYSLFLVSKQ